MIYEPKQTVHPNGVIQTDTFDDRGNCIETKFTGFNLTRIVTRTFDEANRLLTVKDPDFGIDEFVYDEVGNLVTHSIRSRTFGGKCITVFNAMKENIYFHVEGRPGWTPGSHQLAFDLRNKTA